MENEAILVQCSKNGDSRAFSEICEKYTLDLYRFALYIVGNKEDAEDSVQEALISAWKNIGALKDDSLFKPWLFKITSNKCKSNLCRRMKNPEKLPIDDYNFLIGDDGENVIKGAELREALKRLTPPDGQIILMSVIGGFTSDEIGKIYNMTPSTVRSRQKRALEKLKATLS